MKIIAVRRDAFGERMCAFLNTMVIASKLNLDFGFHWYMKKFISEGSENEFLVPIANLPKVDEMFHQNFIKLHYLGDDDLSSKTFLDFVKFKNKDIDILKSYFRYEWGDYCYFQGYLSKIFKYDDDDYKKDLLKAWQSIHFSDRYENIIKKVNLLSQKLGNFLSIHVRAGDIVYNNAGKHIHTARLKAIPFHLAIVIIKNFVLKCKNKDLKVKNILIFGDDLNSVKELKKQAYFSEFNILTIDDIISSTGIVNGPERTFFEILLMSKSIEIYSTGLSGFSRLASMISVGKHCIINDTYSLLEQYNMLKSGINNFYFNNKQTAFSYFMLYLWSSRLKVDIDNQEKYLEYSVFLYKECFVFKVFYIYVLLLKKKMNLVVKVLHGFNIEDVDNFASTLLCKGWGRDYQYKFMFECYIQHQDVHLFLRFIASQILQNIDDGHISKYITFFSEPIVFQSKYGTAKQRIQNQLSYKLGQAMIVNSKSILGYIRMPFVLSYIYDKHKQEQKIYQENIKKDPSLKLPPLENYPDYKEALKEKECFTYKLGETLIKASNNWYGAGYIKLLLETRKLKKKFEKKEIK
ncbi:hypothetical protein ACMCWU_001487 [Campylobacter coli]